MHPTTYRTALSFLALISTFFFASCTSAPRPRAYGIQVDLDPALAGSSLQVDLIGANPVSDLPKYETYSVSDYWKPGDALRRDALKVTLAFGQGRPISQTLNVTDPAWQRWLQTGAQYLVVLVDLPGIAADRAGNADPRRLILPLDAARWSKTDTLHILVQESGARLLTPQKPQ
jgi:hypothetical protein